MFGMSGTSALLRIKYAEVILTVVAWIAGVAFGVLAFHTQTSVRTVHVKPTLAQILSGQKGPSIAEALGKPDQEVPGEQVSPNLKGLTCGVWNSHQLILCWRA